MRFMAEEQGWMPLGIVKGPKGDPGTGLIIKDFYSTLDELRADVSEPSVGDAYGVGEEGNYAIYIWSPSRQDWINSGVIQPDINHQAPVYLEAEELTELTSKERIDTAFGKIKKAIKELISHLTDGVKHITSDEREAWNKKAPGGHGLGVIADGSRNVPFSGFMKYGGGLFQVQTSKDAPFTTQQWFGLLQLIRGLQENEETGVQLSFNDYDVDNPKMWIRALLLGVAGPWCEMIHEGNIKNYASQTVTNSYPGNGKFGESYPNKIPITDSTKVVIINMESDAESGSVAGATATFIRGSKIGMSFVTAGSEYPHYGRLSLNWDNGYLTWYAIKSGTNAIQDSSTQLNVKNAKYSYIIID